MSYIGWIILIGLAALGAHLIVKPIMPFASSRGQYSVIFVFIFLIIMTVIIVIARHQLPSLTLDADNQIPLSAAQSVMNVAFGVRFN
jgi:hypothetical protein